MKKLLATLMAVSLISVHTSAETIYESVTDTTVTEGVTHSKINTFTDSGWIRANVLRIDMTNENLELKVMTSPDGTSSLDTVKTMATYYNTKAAVNADFFNMLSGETNMLGMVYQDGNLISTPSKDNFVSFAITEDNNLVFDYFTFTGTLYAEDTSLADNASCELYQINKVPVDTGAITMITSHWGEKVTVPAYCYAMICEPHDTDRYKMTGSSWGGEAVAIPENGAVFIANYSVNPFLNLNFAQDDIIRVETKISPDIEKIKEASGGNTLIVDNGEVCEFTSNITGKNPRTAMGISPSGKTLVLVTVDGRQSDCAGFTQTDMADFMIALGCDKAINLDGGGSSTMVTVDRFTGQQTVQNSVTTQRQVSTALGVVSHAYGDVAVNGEIQTSATHVIKDGFVEVYAAFYDEYYNTVPLVPEDISYTTSDNNALIEDNRITFSKKGTHSIWAEYEGVILETEVEVVDDIFAINIYPEKVNTLTSSKSFVVTGYDQSGVSVNIPNNLVEYVTQGDIVMTDNTVEKGENTGVVTATYNTLTSSAIVNGEKYDINKEDIKAPDDYEGYIENGEKITIAGSMETPKNYLGRFQIKERLIDLSLRGDVYAIDEVYDPWGIFTVYRKTDGFTERVIDNTKIVTVSNLKNSSIRVTDSTAWGKIKTVCETITQDNLVLIMNEPLYKMNEGEQLVWNYYMDMLTEKGVNVFVVSKGEKSEATTDNGVRYLYVGTLSTPSIGSYYYDLNTTNPLTITIKDNKIKYTYDI